MPVFVPRSRRSSRTPVVVAIAFAAFVSFACWTETRLFLWARLASSLTGADTVATQVRSVGASQQLPTRRRGHLLKGPRIARGAESDATPASPARVGVIHVPSCSEADFRSEFEKLNVTSDTYFQTEVPNAFQLPLAAKLLAMSNTVDVIVAAHGELQAAEVPEVMRGFQTVSLTTNVPVVPLARAEDVASAASSAVQMAEIVQQARGTGVRRSIFFGIGANKTSTPAKKEKVYF